MCDIYRRHPLMALTFRPSSSDGKWATPGALRGAPMGPERPRCLPKAPDQSEPFRWRPVMRPSHVMQIMQSPYPGIHVSCILLLEWSTTSQGCGCIGFLSPMHKKIPDSYSKREGGNPGNSGLSSQQWMVVHYPRTVWKICYAEHEVTGKTYN